MADVGSTIVVGCATQQALLDRLARFAKTEAEILITGPTGVGKELYAQYAHDMSQRRNGPFVVVNCSNLGGDLLENEIFGHARGAYTGAHAPGEGLATAAEGGTLFLDEIDSLPLASQAKLLRFVQQREYRRLGEPSLRRANIRFVAASNSDLPTLVERGLFRSDFYFRLRVAPIEIPPLAQRPDDIPPLLDAFVKQSAADYGVEPVTFAPCAMRRMLSHEWPGNVRELENLVRYATCLQLGRPAVAADLTPLHSSAASGEPGASPAPVPSIDDQPMREVKEAIVGEFERVYINQALERADGNITRAAEASGKHRRAFFELMRKHGLHAGAARSVESGT